MSVLPPDPVFVLRNADMDSVHSLAFHQDQRLLAGTLKGNAYLWDLQRNRCALNFTVGSEPITAMHHSDEKLITQEKGGTLKYWSMTNTGYVLEQTTRTEHIAFCRSDHDGELDSLIFPVSESNIGIIHTKDWEQQTLLVPDPSMNLGTVMCLKQLNWGGQRMVLAGYESGTFLTWDLRSEKVISECHFDVGSATCVDFDVRTNRGVIGGSEKQLIVVTFQLTDMQLSPKTVIPIRNAGVNCVRIRNDRKVFTTGGWDGRIRIFSWKSLRPLAVLTEHKSGGIMDIAYSTGKVCTWNSPIMAAGGTDGQISLWNLYN